jgi:hypothetical protein
MFDRFIEHYRKLSIGGKIKIFFIIFLIIIFGPPIVINTVKFLATLDFNNCVPKDKVTIMTKEADICKN